MATLTYDDEQRLRELAVGMAKGLEDEDELFKRLGFTRGDYDQLADTRTFREILSQATSEWEGANNTHKRVKFKAAANVEQALPSFYQAMVDDKEPLSSRVKALEVIARIGQLGVPELIPAGGGQFFKLEINLGDNKPPLIIEHGHNATSGMPDAGIEDVGAEHARGAIVPHSRSELRQSKVWDDVPRESL